MAPPPAIARSSGGAKLKTVDKAAVDERQGARLVGEVPSGSIPGRMLPLLEVDL